MKRIINWKLFFILLVLCVITSLLVIPYSLTITSSETEITPVILLFSILQNGVLFAVAVFFGLLLSKQIGMGLPILQGAIDGKNQVNALKSIFLPSVIFGAVAGY